MIRIKESFLKSKFPILYYYIFREIFSPFLLCLFIFTGILFLIRSLQLTDLIVNKNVPLLNIIVLFSCIIPRFLELAIPMSLLISVIIAFGRLSSDSEIIVMKATGISLSKLALPTLGFSFICLLFALSISCWIRPTANAKFSQGAFEILKTKASAGLIPGIFNELGDITIYAQNIDQDLKKLSGVIIGDRNDPKNPRTFIASYGDLASNNTERSIILRLYNGIINEGFFTEPKITSFSVTSISFNPESLLNNSNDIKNKKLNEMQLPELWQNIQATQPAKPASKELVEEKNKLLVELNNRFTIPLSCLGVALIALCLGIAPPRQSGSWGLSASMLGGILMILVYYGLLALANALCGQGKVSAWVIWLPNIMLLVLGLYFFRQLWSERWIAIRFKFKVRLH
ncbi:MAG: LPS export ABC transporter permease LptF [Deltaproteobacteria bacterium]|jgi:lipopolysaccharide export system permease protein|nr:LPS export ABC transporter permease LptF [Deltaproteobacteria bacterium]